MNNELFGIPHKAAHYYCEHDLNLELGLKTAVECLALVGLSPTSMITSLDKKFDLFERRLRKCRKSGFASIRSLSIYCVPDHLDAMDPARGYLGNFSISNGRYGIIQKDLNFCLRSNLLPEPLFDDICLRMARYALPRYAGRAELPGASHLLGNFEFHTDGDQFHLGGFVEKVYTWNVLNEFHLRRIIEGVTFADWVRSDLNRGTLDPYVDKTWLWRVAEDRTEEVSKSLRAAEILFDEQKHYYSWIWPFNSRTQRGDLRRPDVVRLIVKYAQETGRFRKPPFYDSVKLTTDDKEMSALVNEAGFEAASKLAPPPIPAPRSEAETVAHILGSLGVTAENSDVIQFKKGKKRRLSDEEKQRMLPEK